MVEQCPDRLPKAITDQAARWMAESFDGKLAAERQAELDRWLAADLRHAQAYDEMQAVWTQMGAIPNAGAVRVATPLPAEVHKVGYKVHRRRHWAVPAIAASVVLVTIGAVQDWPTQFRADEMTSIGERRSVHLPDGSRVQLDTQSAIAVDYTSTQRGVRLLKGGAIFSVAPDRRRPFTVEAAGGETTALGTRFLVRLEEDRTRVVVTEHKVRVAYAAAQAQQASTAIVSEGQGLIYGPHSRQLSASAIDTDDVTSWADGVLVFKDRPLSEVAAAIGRYHRGYVQVIGEARSMRVSGVFRIDDPGASFAQLERSLGLRSAQITDRMIFIFR